MRGLKRIILLAVVAANVWLLWAKPLLWLAINVLSLLWIAWEMKQAPRNVLSQAQRRRPP